MLVVRLLWWKSAGSKLLLDLQNGYKRLDWQAGLKPSKYEWLEENIWPPGSPFHK